MSLAVLTGCASYNAATLATLPAEQSVYSQKNPGVVCAWKIFDQQDSEKYLGRDLISEGYIPVQMTIRNQSNDPMYLNASNFNIPLPSNVEIADKVHTSTAARVLGWGVPGLVIWPLLIPAVYDGLQSQKANQALDTDYASKVVREHTIQPHSNFNGVVFIPKELAGQPIETFLVNQRTSEKIACPMLEVSAQ